MMDWLNFRYRLWKAERAKDRLENNYRKALKKVKGNPKHPYEEEEIWAEFSMEMDFADDEINGLITANLLRTAARLMLPVPGRSEQDMWEDSRVSQNRSRYLSRKGVTELRAAIRKERRESREHVVFWASLTTGIIGALTGLASVLVG